MATTRLELTGGDHHGPDDVRTTHGGCRGGTCDDPGRCIDSGGCTYKSSSEEAREYRARTTKSSERQWSPGQDTAPVSEPAVVRTFVTGANRNPVDGKIQYSLYLSARVMKRYGEYMLQHSVLADGSIRTGDNWQKGIPLPVYMDSMFRHFMSVWFDHQVGLEVQEEDLCGLLFNVMGYLHERLRT